MMETQENKQISKACTQEKSKPLPNAKRYKMLASLVFGNLFLGSCYSLMAPFFPQEAELKHIVPSQYGFIFGVNHLTIFLSAPFIGKLVPILKPAKLMKLGMTVSGISNICFGFLNYVPAGYPFLASAFIVRIIDALGTSSFLTASYATLGLIFPDLIGRAMSIAETAFAAGLAGGPALGGAIYQIGGFTAPFCTIGVLLLTGVIVNIFLFSEIDDEIDDKRVSAWKIILNIDFFIDVIVIMTALGIVTFNESTLEPHIRKFGLSPIATGGIFLISGLVDAVVAPIWGYFAEKSDNAHNQCLLAAILFFFSFLIVGPVRFLPFPTLLWVVILSQVILGLGMAGEFVCAFTHGMKNIVKRGFPENASTYGIVSGVLFASSCLGGFSGPSIGGFLIQYFGYKDSTLFIIAVQILVITGILLRLVYLFFKRKTSDRRTSNNPETCIHT